jgi:hypothetical protein
MFGQTEYEWRRLSMRCHSIEFVTGIVLQYTHADCSTARRGLLSGLGGCAGDGGVCVRAIMFGE